jgi:hypothetical protein
MRHSSALLAGATLALVLGGCAKKEERKEVPAPLQGSYRSLKAIEGATRVGVTFPDYGRLLQALSAEVLTLGDYLKANPSLQYRALEEELTQVLVMYADAETVWKAQVESSGRERNLKLYPQAELVALKYGMAEREISMRIVQTVWSVIGARADVLHEAFYGVADLTRQKPKTLDELREAALFKKGVADCVEVEYWNPDTKTSEGWFIVGAVVNRCGKGFDSVQVTFIVWEGGERPSGEMVREIGPIRAAERKTFRVPYPSDITGVRYKAIRGERARPLGRVDQ